MSVPLHHQHQAYAVAGDEPGGFVVACGKCQAVGRLGTRKDLRASNEDVLQRFRRLGWIVADRNPRHNRCPTCLGSRGGKPVLSLDRKEEPPMTTTPVAAPRDLTISETVKVSVLLHDQFDGEKGEYSTGWDDERIAREVNVPRAAVAALRSAHWGDLKADPEILALKADLAAIREMVREGINRLSNESKTVGKLADEVDRRLSDLERKRGQHGH